jgi:membrane-bound serine protease (ClpP class)
LFEIGGTEGFQIFNMNKILWIALIGILLTSLGGEAPCQEKDGEEAQVEKEKAVLYPLEGMLAQTMTMRLKRAVAMAEELGARTLILEINTPGGEMMLMEQLRNMIFDAHQKNGLNTVAYINHDADSAGALIAMACQELYMSPLAHIGSATPVATSPLQPLMPLLPGIQDNSQDDMMNKIKSRARAVFRATAIETGRNEAIAEAMVDPDVELVLALVEDEEKVLKRQDYNDLRARLGDNKVIEYSIVCAKGELLNMTAREALEWGFIDGIPETRDEMLESFLGIDKDQLFLVKPSWSEKLVDFLQSIHFLLLIAGLILLYVEFQVPGFGIPGILGLSCLGILFFGKYMVGLAEFTEILMVIFGLGFIVVEIFILPGTLIFGILGGLLVLFGLILSFQPFIVPDAPWETDLFVDNITYLGLSIIGVLIGMAILSRFLPKVSIFQRFVLDTGTAPGGLHASAGTIDDVAPELLLQPGDRGTVQTTLRPAGKVIFDGTAIDAQSEGGYIDAGEDVEIVRVTGNFVFVRKVKESST